MRVGVCGIVGCQKSRVIRSLASALIGLLCVGTLSGCFVLPEWIAGGDEPQWRESERCPTEYPLSELAQHACMAEDVYGQCDSAEEAECEPDGCACSGPNRTLQDPAVRIGAFRGA